MEDMAKQFFIALIALSFILPFSVRADTAATGTDEVMKARVVSVTSDEKEKLLGTNVWSRVETAEVVILSGSYAGSQESVTDDSSPLFAGETVFVTHTVDPSQNLDVWTVSDPDRLPILLALLLVFVLCVALFGGLSGIRGIVSLAIGVALIVYLFLPAILRGFSPFLLSAAVASFIVVIGSYITHGFNRTTSSAVIGMVATIAIAGVLAHVALGALRLSGLGNEDAAYLNIATGGTIDFVGLLFGGILIGLLGVLYDAAIGQAVAVCELAKSAPHLLKKEIFLRAMRIGREHIGALVNTLAIAYVGASLPLLLLFYSSATGHPLFVLNKEIFSTEIARTLVGSIGLVLAVPITTAIAVFMHVGRDLSKTSSHGHVHF